MARKSRKNLPQPEQATVSVQFPELDEEKIPTAIYGRLSVEDDEDNESMETQIALVQDFINRSSELNYVDTYFDNGFTGTNFDRPGFQKMMDGVRSGEIDTIIVKDLSRFGRDYIGVGEYMEQIFPLLGVRLISINDNYDSSNYNGTTLGMGFGCQQPGKHHVLPGCRKEASDSQSSKMAQGHFYSVCCTVWLPV